MTTSMRWDDASASVLVLVSAGLTTPVLPFCLLVCVEQTADGRKPSKLFFISWWVILKATPSLQLIMGAEPFCVADSAGTRLRLERI